MWISRNDSRKMWNFPSLTESVRMHGPISSPLPPLAGSSFPRAPRCHEFQYDEERDAAGRAGSRAHRGRAAMAWTFGSSPNNDELMNCRSLDEVFGIFLVNFSKRVSRNLQIFWKFRFKFFNSLESADVCKIPDKIGKIFRKNLEDFSKIPVCFFLSRN